MGELDVLIFKMQLFKMNLLNLQMLKCCIDAFEVPNISLGDNCIALEWSIRSAFSWAMFELWLT